MTSTTATVDPSRSASGNAVPLAIIGGLFFIFGFVTWLNGSLIPFLKIICHLDTFEALLVTFAFYIAYTVMALPMSAILSRTGYRDGMAVGLGIMAVGALIHIPAAYAASFPLFLLGLFTLGAGLTILQTASNPYIVLLGPIESAAARISIMGVVNKGAGVIVPMVFTALILGNLGDPAMLAKNVQGAAAEHALAARLVVPYLCMAVALAALVGVVRFAPLPEIAPPVADHDHGGDGIFRHPHLILGVVTLFAYVGLEVLAGDTIGLFGSHLNVPQFTTLTSFTMAFMVIGYVIGIVAIPRFVTQRLALALCGVAGLLITLGIVFSAPSSSAVSAVVWGWLGLRTIPDPVFFVALLGLANALVWPTVWPLALDGLGRHTARASALLIMAISGGAVIPLLFGWIANKTGMMQQSYWIAAPCYLMIVYYALKGSQIRSKRSN